MTLKIGIVGKMCSGKSTTAQYFKELNDNFYLNSFANKVKLLAVELFGMKEKDRTLLIQIGEKMREIRDTVWIDCTINECNEHELAIIDDVRHINEHQTLKSNGWKIIKLNISHELQKKRLIKLYPDTHNVHMKHINNITETGAVNLPDDNFDLIINVDEENVHEQIKLFYDEHINNN
jgi:dephospho-CoA kinase